MNDPKKPYRGKSSMELRGWECSEELEREPAGYVHGGRDDPDGRDYEDGEDE